MSSNTNFVVKKGDLFQGARKGSSFAHCISKDVKLGRGIAVSFRQRFGNVDELRSQNSDVGDISTIMLEKNCFVYNLITKEKFNGKPSYESLEDCLLKMRQHAIEHGVREISCPKLACGLDNLSWLMVSDLIDAIFADTGIKISVFYLHRHLAND